MTRRRRGEPLPPSCGNAFYPGVRIATTDTRPEKNEGLGTFLASRALAKSVALSESDATSRSGVSGDGGAETPATHMSTSTATDETAGSTRDDRENDLVTDGGQGEPIDVPGGGELC